MTTDPTHSDAELIGGSYLNSVVHLLWPTPIRIDAARRRRVRSSAAPASYAILPSATRPKLLVPSRPRRVAAGAVRNFKTASTTRERLVLGALALGARLGLHDWLPSRLIMDAPPGESVGIDAHLCQVLGRRIHVCLYIGPARAVRKPVLQLLDDHGSTIAFAKLGVDDFTDSLVRSEARAVARVADADTSILRVPEVWHNGTWSGHALLVQSALPRGAAGTAWSAPVAEALREIAAIDGLTTDDLGSSTYWARMTARVHSLEPGPNVVLLRRALDEILAAHARTRMQFGASHGDFTPWNMTILAGRALVWDWEKFETDVPVGFDAVHCAIQGMVVFGGSAPADAFATTGADAQSLLASTGNRKAADLVVWLYAVDIATRYLMDREQEAGTTRMTDLAAWLPSVLGRCTTVPKPP